MQQSQEIPFGLLSTYKESKDERQMKFISLKFFQWNASSPGSNTVLIMGSGPFSIYMAGLEVTMWCRDYKNSWLNR